jgi:thioredoxin-like negative regulator of GroEL
VRRRRSNLSGCGKEGSVMIDVTERGFDKEVLECDMLVFSCFTTKWCHSCYPTCLLADELVKEYEGSVKFVRVDMEKSSGISERYHIVAVPTILLFQNSQPVKRLLGFQDRRSLKHVLDMMVAAGEEVPGEKLIAGSGPKFPQPSM